MRYQFEDDIDFVGTEAFVNENSMVFLSLTPKTFEIFPAYKRNVVNYRRYSEAMNDAALVALRDKLAADPYEKRLIDSEDGKYFVEKHYVKSKIYEAGVDLVRADNPFAPQVPFIRLEGHLTTRDGDGILLADLGGEEVKETHLSREMTDISSRLALKARVKGNGKRGAVVIRLSTTFNNAKGVADHLVMTDHEGWRDIVVAELDNGNFPEFNAPMPGDLYSYSYYRSIVNFEKVDKVDVFTVGECDGVELESVRACLHEDLPSKNVTLEAQGSSLTFATTLAADEYIEYYPEKGEAVKYDRFGNGESVTVIGSAPTLPQGESTLCIRAEDKGAPSRFTVTLGFTGSVIK
jgi:hypothetical protein